MTNRTLAAQAVLVAVAALAAPGSVAAQYTKVSTPFNRVSDGFFERIGVGFGFNIRGGNPNGSGTRVVGLGPTGQPTANGAIQFNQGGFNTALPPFGGHNPAADGRAGFAVLGNEGGLFFNFAGGQGSDRSFVSQTPSVVIPNGGQGTIIDTTQRPFVTSVIPVVGAGFPRSMPALRQPAISPLRQRLAQLQAAGGNLRDLLAQQEREREIRRAEAPRHVVARPIAAAAERPLSSAEHGDLSVAEIRRRQAAQSAEQDQEARQLWARAKLALAQGKRGAAKVYYQMAARRAKGELKQQIVQELRELTAAAER